MEVQLTPDQEVFVRQAIESGRLHHPQEAIQQALSLWEARERSRACILSALDEAEDDIKAGRFTDYTDESLPTLGDDIRRRARAMVRTNG